MRFLSLFSSRTRRWLPCCISIWRLLLCCCLQQGNTVVVGAAAYSLSGKRALITGSSGGIGKGIALALAEQGCHALIHYHERQQGAEDTRAQIQALHQQKSSSSGRSTDSLCAGILQCDFRSPPAILEMMRAVDEIWPDGFDILINNAGIVSKLALQDDDLDLATWHETMSVNLHAPRLLSQLAVPRMMKQRKSNGDNNQSSRNRTCGVIVNVSSIHGEKSNEYVAAYAASKAALDSLTRSMAMEYAQHNIRVNSIAPGVVVVERTADTWKVPENVQVWTDRLPLNRLGQVDDIAQATLTLLTNDWMTGTILTVDGGMMARANMPSRSRPLKSGGVC
jgi:glucose 1-dehydrogenase